MLRIVTILGTILLSTGASAGQSEPAPWHWLEGNFSNYQYTVSNPEAGYSPVLFTFTNLEHNDDDDVLVLAQQFHLFDQTLPLRQQILRFTPRRQGWRQEVYDLEPELLLGDVLDEDNWQHLAGCRYEWRKEGEEFIGATDPGRCFFVVQGQDVRVGVATTMRLSRNNLWVDDTLVADEAFLAARDASDIRTHFQRLTYFAGEIQYRPRHDSEWQQVELANDLHDQGTLIGLIDPSSGLELRYQLELVREHDYVQLKIYDITRQDYIHSVEHPLGQVIQFESANLTFELAPLP
ncbi:CpcT/CpeT family chromophore lyase [Aliidiomarina maris]|uniref:CpeT/CpcT family protein DUF1001 n=1 Tax=Aliidiomarina maris TaxID=531312 RepID=A0A327WXI2_9GAMM|nr:CpcT/CpeT family chromophore lyase [Aliidiomarina maris]MCL5049822.1 CpcT/CpeT family chromophore lyase [Bacillota bacterium]RAJ96924.1 CpeT/CpcT family protein DUF1001 [Aliidiomarina maris]RUO24138.1 hypothetical protein CWE07_08585 [Aliidiomarina maris]